MTGVYELVAERPWLDQIYGESGCEDKLRVTRSIDIVDQGLS
jgi:hypothetical protein